MYSSIFTFVSFTSIQSFFCSFFLFSSGLPFPPFLSFFASSFFGSSFFAPFLALGVYIFGDDLDDLIKGLSSSSYYLLFLFFFGFSSSGSL
jgi:hypothetical protein